MAITIQHIDHVVLWVSDMERARRFYCDVLGCKVERRVESLPLLQLRAGSSLIDLRERSAAAPATTTQNANMDHLALRIDPFDEAVLRAHLQAHGIPPGEVKQLYGADGIGPAMYLQDPDGNTLELKGPRAN